MRLFLWFFWGIGLTPSFLIASEQPLRILLDQLPLTLNPRIVLDLTGQRVSSLLYRGLTKIDSQLNAKPDLAESWEVLNRGKKWRFWIKANLKDHAGYKIDAHRLAACLEEYRQGYPPSALSSKFAGWRATKSITKNRGGVRLEAIDLEFDKPNPYLAREISALRYFTSIDQPAPCREPIQENSIIGSGIYKIENWGTPPPQNLLLTPKQSGHPKIELIVVRDETTRVMKLLNGEADVIQNGISASKSRWIEREHGDRFSFLLGEGVNISYLAFNLRDPILSRREVRQAIAKAIDRDSYIQHKALGFVKKAGSLMSPLLPESVQIPTIYDPSESERLLDQVGFPRNKNGVRFSLHYKTTPVREGLELAQLVQQWLRKIGIDLVLDVVEPAVFLATIRKGAFQLYSSRWVGVADGSILFSTLRSGQKNNRVGYHNVQVDLDLDRAKVEMELGVRHKLLQKVQLQMMEDLPYYPLWFWTNGLMIRKELSGGLSADKLSLKGAFEPILESVR